MQEKIYLAPGLNGIELKKSLASHGIPTFGVRIIGAAELADLSLVRAGVFEVRRFLSSSEESVLIAEALEGVSYFGRTTWQDIQTIASAIRMMREFVPDGDEENALQSILSHGIFQEKNEALWSVYHKYMQLLSDNGAIDPILLIREAIEKGTIGDALLYTIREYPLSPIEEELASALSNGTAAEISLSELYNADLSVNLHIDSYKNAYGSANEVESIIDAVYHTSGLDECTVAVSEPATYAQLFFDYSLLYNIPTTFGCGIPIINANPAKLLKLYYNWMTEDFFSGESLEEMIRSPFFDGKKLRSAMPAITDDMDFDRKRFHDYAKSIRFTNDPLVNGARMSVLKGLIRGKDAIYLPFLDSLSTELSLPAEEFIRKYSYVRHEDTTYADRVLSKLDLCAVSTIYDSLSAVRGAGVNESIEDIIKNILGMRVCREVSTAGAMHVTTIPLAMSCVRKNLYIAGLSASKFPGAPSENYLLLDSDLSLFGLKKDIFSSEGRVRAKKECFYRLIDLASGLRSRICISYAGINVSELKKENASSVIYELFRKEHGENASSADLENAVTRIDYFEPAIQSSRLIGTAYNEGKEILPDEIAIRDSCLSTVKGNLEKEYSPTALNTFFGCPRSFFIGYILGIPQPEDKDELAVMDAAETGILAHAMMEHLANSKETREEFLSFCEKSFDEYILQHTPVISGKADTAKDEFMRMMENGFDGDPHREVVLDEEDVHCIHESGVKIHGFPDRVEKLPDGSCLIVDFKTGRKLNHMQDDIDTCFQIVLYAYLMEQKGYRVQSGEFRYIRRDETVTCVYDDEMKQKLAEKLEIFKRYMEQGEFPLSEARNSETGSPCTFCKYGSICGKESI